MGCRRPWPGDERREAPGAWPGPADPRAIRRCDTEDNAEASPPGLAVTSPVGRNLAPADDWRRRQACSTCGQRAGHSSHDVYTQSGRDQTYPAPPDRTGAWNAMVIALDVDGTLFDGQSASRRRRVDACAARHADGHTLIIVTGRRWETPARECVPDGAGAVRSDRVRGGRRAGERRHRRADACSPHPSSQRCSCTHCGPPA